MFWSRQKTRRLARRTPPGSAKLPQIRGTVVCDDPLVLLIADFNFQFSLVRRSDLWARWRDKPALIILLRSSAIFQVSQFKPWHSIVKKHQDRHPLHRIVYAANTPAELEVLKAAEFEGLYCNHNAFVNEHVFQPPPEAKAGDTREFDAIYNARFSRFKRHQLAVRVQRLALIHYEALNLVEPLWWLRVRVILRRAKVMNRTEKGFWRWPHMLSPDEVSAANNRARVGLCLSATEGAMLSSIQYLLCGLPVVTTPSRGGRDVFFDAENSITVVDDAKAVAGGVQTIIARNSDPWEIRAATIFRMNEHRARFIEFVDAWQKEQGVPVAHRLSTTWELRQIDPFNDRLD